MVTLIDGVSVVNEYCCSSFQPTNTIVACVIWIIGVVAMFLMSRVVFYDAKERTIVRCVVSTLFAIVFICVAFESYNNYMNQWIEYDVVVSDSVSYNEFTSKYEVIGENDGILRVICK